MQAFVSCEAMNRVIAACRESILVLDEAVHVVKDPMHRDRLREQSLGHSLMLLELEEWIAAIGGISISRTSFVARVRAFWRRLRNMFGGGKERRTIAACLNAEVRTEAAYAAALSLPLSPSSRQNLKFQSDKIVDYYRCLKTLS